VLGEDEQRWLRQLSAAHVVLGQEDDVFIVLRHGLEFLRVDIRKSGQRRGTINTPLV
jgi:hypothetical protein